MAHGTEVEQFTGPMVHCNMSMGQMGHSKRQDHGAWIVVTHGIDVEVSESPMGHT